MSVYYPCDSIGCENIPVFDPYKDNVRYFKYGMSDITSNVKNFGGDIMF